MELTYPFATATEFHDTLRAGDGLQPRAAELVADAIAQLIASRDEEAVLVPEQVRRRPA